MLDLTVGAVKSRLYRARRALAEMMRGETTREKPVRKDTALPGLVRPDTVRQEEVCYAV